MRALLWAGCGVLLAATGFGHHGTSVTYHVDKTIAISGTVTEFDFVYPHLQLYFGC